ncbi:MAG: carbon-nitrogen hydrolase family protein [Bacillota bacterium]|nr:MAG: carbon-nitrogen hydrolase family protein [Bacillota bacterium]
MKVRVALVQMDVALGLPKQNYQTVTRLTKDLKPIDIILLPELWSTGYDLTNAAKLAESDNGPTVHFMQELAQQHSAYVGGSILMQRHHGVCNTFVLVSPQGIITATYDKTHLFGLMQEDVYLSSGRQLVSIQTEFGSAGLAICYDLRFPEIFRRYADVPVDFTFLVAEWPLPRIEHWRTLIRARAIENQCYMLACNRVGTDTNNTFFGHSMVVDPWGEILLEANDSEVIFTVEIDTASIGAARAKIPVLTDRRRELY